MSRNMNVSGTLNAYMIRPDEVLAGDHYGYKLLARIDEYTWTVYKGLTDWSDEEVLDRGDSVSEEVAFALFPSLQYDREYYR
jgi:hypothetical protein